MDKNLPIIALDFNDETEVLSFLNKLNTSGLNLKIGMELFYSSGHHLLHKLIADNHHIFLDLKLHDIPNTVERAMTVLAKLGIDMINVHASGGKEMMQAAKRGLENGCENGKKPLLIAVTQLTSTTQAQLKHEQLTSATMSESVLNYAKLAKESGLDGIVCSPHEANDIKQILGDDFLTITPGIRLDTDQNADDQKRIMTPKDAKHHNSDYIVVGRPITQSENPKEIYQQILKDWRS